mgnify:CR=1 FL=1
MKKISFLLCIFFTLCNVNYLIAQEKRIALVIGNSTYTNSPLKNPVNDANLMESILKQLGFYVIKSTNASKSQMEQAIREFSENLENHNVALFFYAGHGMQTNGINYLIPTDAKLAKETDLKYEAISLNFVVEEFERHPQNTNIVILDACRDNPLASWARGGTRGFKAVNPSQGTIISFATAEGSTASDGDSNNGLFTSKLVQQIVKPQPIESVFKNTRVEVIKASNGKQSPQEWSMLTGNFQFVNGSSESQINLSQLISSSQQVNDNNLLIKEEVLTGTIRILSNLDGEFFFDEKFMGNFTKGRVYTLENIEIGLHNLKIGDWNKSIKVEKDKTHSLSAQTDLSEIEMVLITGGTFKMGSSLGAKSEMPVHSVNVNDFFLSIYEITHNQWFFVMGSNHSSYKGCNECPVSNINWNEVQDFLKKINESTGKKYRLPTEAEWEYAARGGIYSKNYEYSGSNNVEEVAFFEKNSENTIKPVGQKMPNELGIYDMSGNVWEWCSDWYSRTYYSESPLNNPKGPLSGNLRSLRGGSWYSEPKHMTVFYRSSGDPNNRNPGIGFRIALDN